MFASRKLVALAVVAQFVLAPLAAFAGPTKTSEADASLRVIIDEAMGNPITARFLERQMSNELRHGIDRTITMKLESHPQYNLLRAKAQEMLNKAVEEYRVDLGSRVASAVGEELAVVSGVSARLDFPVKERNEARVFVDPTNEVNAYTYSPGPYIDFVYNRGLIDSFHAGAKRIADRLTKKGHKNVSAEEIANGAIASVAGHELGHIKAGHVRNRVILISLFMAAAQQSIKGDEELSVYKKRQALKEVTSDLKEHLRMTLNHEFGPGSLAKRSVPSAVVDKLFASIVDFSNDLLARNPSEVEHLGAEFFHAMKQSAEEASKPVARPKPAVQTARLTSADVAAFKALLIKLGRSCETTSDRLGQISTSTRHSEYADMLLSGATDIDEVKAAAYKLRLQFETNPELLEKVSSGSHPRPLYRVLAYQMFEGDIMYRIYTDAYLKALHTYFGIANYMEELQIRQDQDTIEIAENRNAAIDRQLFFQLEGKLVDLVMVQIEKDLRDPSRGLSTIVETSKYLGYRGWSRMKGRSLYSEGIAGRANMAHGFFGRLKELTAKILAETQKEYSDKIKEAADKKNDQAVEELREAFKARTESLMSVVNQMYKYAPRSDVNESKDALAEAAGGLFEEAVSDDAMPTDAFTNSDLCRNLLTVVKLKGGKRVKLKAKVSV